MSFPKRFDTSREQELYRKSIKAGYFKPEYRPDAEPFVIPVPPPNVTGVLHIGHGLFVTIQDAYARFRRMKGKAVLWAPGTDHAGISTQVQVEKKIKKEHNLTRHDLGRVEFLKRVRDFASDHRQIILDQFKLLGASMDRDREQFTLSEGMSRAVRKSFKNLYDQGKVYLGYRIANRCTRCQTVLSDAEVEMKSSKGKIYHIRYFLVGGKNINIDVYTTRPETIPADVALAVHPNDKRYKQFIGKEVIVPFVNRKIPVITDERVDMSFGTGVLKITPAHDATDFDIGTRHNLPLDIFALDKNGKWSSNIPEFSGYDVDKFFDTYIERLKEIGNLIDTQEHDNHTPHCERCATKIEPMGGEQWFVDVNDYAKQAIQSIDDGEVHVYPERYTHIFHQWLDNIKPRCISRQLWRGHRIPVRQNESGDSVVVDEDYIQEKAQLGTTKKSILSLMVFNCIADSKLEERFEFSDVLDVLTKGSLLTKQGTVFDVYYRSYATKFTGNDILMQELGELHQIIQSLASDVTNESAHDLLISILKESFALRQEGQFFVRNWEEVTGFKNLKQQSDVLDTWFSSGLWPFSSVGRPDKTTDLAKFYPATLLETGGDILFPWVSRMLMMGLANTGELPFKDIYFHGLVRDEKGAKMSKSVGNVINPLTLMEKYGTDALRLALVTNNPAGNDLNFSETRADYYSRFMTKLWNASRYVWLNAIGEENASSATIDLDTLRGYIKDNQKSLNDFDVWILNGLDELIMNVEKGFVSYAFTNVIDDVVKFTRNNFCDWYIEIAKLQKHDLTDKVMLYIVGTLLKLLHPVAPFVTDALYADMGFSGSLVVSDYPSLLEIGGINTQTKLFIELISEFRNLRNEVAIKPNEKVIALVKANSAIGAMIKQYEAMFCRIVNCSSLTVYTVNQDIPPSFATKLVFDITIGIQTIEPVNTKANLAKLEEQLITERKFMLDLHNLLNSDGFVSSAPEAVVSAKRAKLEEMKNKIQQIEVEIQRLKYLG